MFANTTRFERPIHIVRKNRLNVAGSGAKSRVYQSEGGLIHIVPKNRLNVAGSGGKSRVYQREGENLGCTSARGLRDLRGSYIANTTRFERPIHIVRRNRLNVAGSGGKSRVYQSEGEVPERGAGSGGKSRVYQSETRARGLSRCVLARIPVRS